MNFFESAKKMLLNTSLGESSFFLKTQRTTPNSIYMLTVPNMKVISTDTARKQSELKYEKPHSDKVIDYNVHFYNFTISSESEFITTRDLVQKSVTNNTSSELDLIMRTSRVENQCRKLSVFGTPDNEVRDIMTNRASRLAYCYIPKCGCTYWKRVIRFLNKDYMGRNLNSPFQIRRLEIHRLRSSNPDTFVPFRIFQKISQAYSSFMFVREPYSRLWSAYVDKFYLPDFWVNFQKQIKSNRHPMYARRCVSDITFQEFVSLSLVTQEPHWDPMHQMCDPCTYKPSLIGRVESFADDSRYILDKANLSWIMDGYDHAMHAKEELVTLINYNFELIPMKSYIGRCISKVGMFRRLWKTFQINGYLPADAFPSHLNDTTTLAEFIQIVLDQYRRRPNTPDVWRKQRKEFMVAAYKTISTATLHALRMKYARDFLLFNYDPQPVEIFGNRH